MYKHKIIASLTSYGDRIHTVNMTIETILNQTLKADKVILWLSEDEFSMNTIPQALHKLALNGLTIKFCKDLKSYKKLIPTLKFFPNDIIITFDDDVLYKNNIIEKLYNSYLEEPNVIHCMRGHKMTFDANIKLQPYNNWSMLSNCFQSKYEIFPTGVAGILYFPGCFNNEVFNEERFLTLAPHGDDIWFKAMSLLQGVKSKIVMQTEEEIDNLSFIDNTQTNGLWSQINQFEESGNDKQIKAVFEYYDIYHLLLKKMRSTDIVFTNIYNNDLVSIVIITHNRFMLLQRALNSAIEQTHKNIEIIIVDDASCDETYKVVQEFIKKDLRIRYIKNSINLGSNKSRNIGIKAAKGKFIAGLDDDDEFTKDRIQTLLKNYNSDYSFITSWNIVIKKDGKKSLRKPKSEIYLKDIKVNNLLMNQGLIEKQRLIDINMYDEELQACQDYDLWMRLILKFGKAKVVQEYLQIVHEDDNIKRISSPSHKKFKGYFKFYKKYKYLMNIRDKKDWIYNLYKLRDKPLSKKTLFILLHDLNEKRLSSYYNQNYGLKDRYNSITKLYTFINDLDKSKQYILYGYGSIGKLILPHLQKNILGIIDTSLQEKYIQNIQVMQLNDLKKHNNISILVTPVIHYAEIIKELQKFTTNIIPVEI